MTQLPVTHAPDSTASMTAATAGHGRMRPAVLVGLLLLLASAGTVITTAMLRNSTTFDEIVLIAGGARGYEHGTWQLAPEHPPLMQYIYGLPVWLSRPNYPDESPVSPADQANMGYRYYYAQIFFWASDNEPEKLAALGRLPAVLIAVGLILLAFAWGRRIGGDGVGLLAAGLTAALPDVLAHGGVAYNDVPIALAYMGTLWAMDRAIRDPAILKVVLAGSLIALSLAVKNSALALAPAAVVLLVCEAVARGRDGRWRQRIALAVPLLLVSAYLALVAVYRGDFMLEEYRYAIDFVVGQVTTSAVPAYLLGDRSLHGWWYFFPVAFLFKTSAGLHIVLAIGALSLLASIRGKSLSDLAASPLRGPVVGFLVFSALLVRADLNIGFRYALPALPLLCIVAAAGAVHAWNRWGRPARAAIVVATTWSLIHVGSYYPHFLGYISEYGPGREENYTVLVDSSLDWGQGLLALRDFMRDQDIPSVYLSYFGSAWPAGYGITHVPMLSFFPLPPVPAPDVTPSWVAISATNLNGVYLTEDPYARFRNVRPDRVIANSIYLYHIGE